MDMLRHCLIYFPQLYIQTGWVHGATQPPLSNPCTSPQINARACMCPTCHAGCLGSPTQQVLTMHACTSLRCADGPHACMQSHAPTTPNPSRYTERIECMVNPYLSPLIVHFVLFFPCNYYNYIAIYKRQRVTIIYNKLWWSHLYIILLIYTTLGVWDPLYLRSYIGMLVYIHNCPYYVTIACT